MTPPSPNRAEVDRLVALLRDRSNAVRAGDFPADPAVAKLPGLYAWWADEDGRAILAAGLGCTLDPLIYAGLAGATHWPSGKPSKTTLAQRVRGLHLRGNIRASTFRHTLAAIVREPLHLQVVARNRLTKAGEQELSGWMAHHLYVAVYPYPDRDALGRMEKEILARLVPPLNLAGMPTTPLRAQVKALRQSLAHPS